jgi:hypothetical protein
MDVVYRAAHLFDAHLVRMALEQAGIPAFVLGEALLGGVGELPACGLLAVAVPPSCGDAARALVETLPLVAGEASADAPAEPATWPDGAQPA